MAAGQEESSKLAVFQPSGGLAGMPGRASQLPSVTIVVGAVPDCVELSWSAAMMPLAFAETLRPSTAITLLPATSSDATLATCEVCQPLFAVGSEVVTWVPLTKAVSPSSPLILRMALEMADGSVTVKSLRR